MRPLVLHSEGQVKPATLPGGGLHCCPRGRDSGAVVPTTGTNVSETGRGHPECEESEAPALTTATRVPIESVEASSRRRSRLFRHGVHMIMVTRLNDASFAVNADLIERITAEPDTTLTMVDGVRYVVREPIAEVIERVMQFRADVVARAYQGGGR